MPTDNGLPILGAALNTRTLELHRDWILERQRDLEIQDFFESSVLDANWQDVAAHIKRLLDGHTGRLGIHGPFWGFTIASPDPLIREVVTKRLMQGLDACAAIGATQMVAHSPFTTWDYNHLVGASKAFDSIIDRVHETLDPVVARAEDQGVVLVIENIEDKDPFARVELVESFDSDAIRVSLDTGHAHYAHGNTQAPPVDYYVEAASDLLAHVHIQDADGYADRHWLPGEGTVNWFAVFRALGKLTSDPRLIIEVKDHINIRRGAEHLARLGLAI